MSGKHPNHYPKVETIIVQYTLDLRFIGQYFFTRDTGEVYQYFPDTQTFCFVTQTKRFELEAVIRAIYEGLRTQLSISEADAEPVGITLLKNEFHEHTTDSERVTTIP